MVTGGVAAPTMAMPLGLRWPRISLALNELVVKGKDERRGGENNMDIKVGIHEERAATRYFLSTG
jgi:hypothetical protein